jgi:hypothetical protein
VSWYKNGTLVLNPEFQRRSVWKLGTKSFFIDSVVKGLPIPIVFLRDKGVDLKTYEPTREVIDGQQRLRTVFAYIDPTLLADFDPGRDDFTVRKTHNADLAGRRFKDLDPDLQRRILEYQFNVHVLPSDVDDRDVIQIFRRMNSTNYALNAQELRNAEFFGELKSSVYQLAAEQLHRWRKWKTFTPDAIARMLEVELTSELLLLMLKGEITGRNQKVITHAYEERDGDDKFPERVEVENRFSSVMDSIDDKLGEEMSESPFGQRSLFYGFFAHFYDLSYGLDSSLKKKLQPKTIPPDRIAWVKLAGERIRNMTASKEVLDATTRRATNPKERKLVFNYLQHTSR